MTDSTKHSDSVESEATKSLPYAMGRDDFKRVGDEIMHYCTKNLGLDTMTALPLVTNLTDEIRPIIEAIVNRHVAVTDLRLKAKKRNTGHSEAQS